ncbi:MAG TPA: response regulator [Nitrososphaeraceae archaeon]|nr:response regulator [Nitrososphaeraceae archaeon]
MINNQKKNNRILLVDNEIDISLAFKIGLEDNGFEVDAFDKPDVALSHFNQGMYDLLLLDIKMPNMNGIEFYKRMKEIDEKVKVCFITASEINYFEEIAKEIFPILGVRCLIRKPIKIQDLVKNLIDELKSNNDNDN